MVFHRIAAVVRMLLGGGFLFLGVTKLMDVEFLYGGLLHRIRGRGQAFPLYDQFLFRFVEMQQEQYSYAVAIGESLVGISLLLGIWVSFGTLVGAFLVLNFALATTWDNVPQMLAHLLLVALLVLLGRGGAGLTWGLDRVLINFVNKRAMLFPWNPKVPTNPVRLVPLQPPGRRPIYPSHPRRPR